MNLKTYVTRKPSTLNFPKNEHFSPLDMHMCIGVSRGKKCSFTGKFGVLGFLVTPVLRFAPLLHYRQIYVLWPGRSGVKNNGPRGFRYI